MKVITKLNKLISRKCVYEKYSTEEQFTGKYWIDGKKIYKKAFTGTTASTATSAILGNLDNKDKVISISGVVLSSTIRQIPWVNGSDTISLQVNPNGVLSVYNSNSSLFNINVLATVEYTKTTD